MLEENSVDFPDRVKHHSWRSHAEMSHYGPSCFGDGPVSHFNYNCCNDGFDCNCCPYTLQWCLALALALNRTLLMPLGGDHGSAYSGYGPSYGKLDGIYGITVTR